MKKIFNQISLKQLFIFFLPLVFLILYFPLCDLLKNIPEGDSPLTFYERVTGLGLGFIVLILYPIFIFIIPFILFSGGRNAALRKIGFNGLFLSKLFGIKSLFKQYLLSPFFLSFIAVMLIGQLKRFFEYRTFVFFEPYLWIHLAAPLLLSSGAFLEEVYFRGCFFTLFKNIFSNFHLVIISTIFFLIWHLPESLCFGSSLLWYISILLVSVVNGIIYLKFKRLDYPILIHFVANILLFTPKLFLFR